MKLYMAIVFCLFCNTLFGQCPNVQCGTVQYSWNSLPVVQVQVAPVVVKQSVPQALVRKAVHVPQVLVQTAVQVPKALVLPATSVVVQTPRTSVVVNSVPTFSTQQVVRQQVVRQQVYTTQVYNTSSFHSNGSGQSLAEHLRISHGVDSTGMSVAEQEAKHKEKHGYGSFGGHTGGYSGVSVKVFNSRPRRLFR